VLTSGQKIPEPAAQPLQSGNTFCLTPRACPQMQGSECGDAAVIIAEDEAGAAERSGPVASFLADVEAKLAAAAGVQCSAVSRQEHCMAVNIPQVERGLALPAATLA
jgi:hypothetical protein